MPEVILDVRERDEFEAKHVDGSINLPLSEFNKLAPNLVRKLNQDKITIMCLSGRRAQLAKQQLQSLSLGMPHTYEVFDGGIKKWISDGGEVIKMKSNHVSILRQVHIGAGLLVVLGVVLSLAINPAWIYFSAFVGLGLFFAGATGFCAMASVLAKMPWNKSVKGINDEVCIASSGDGRCIN